MRRAAIICLALSLFDLALGGMAVWKPLLYARFFHPDLAAPPLDFIARTGAIWLFFGVIEALAAWKQDPVWFFAVGLLRLMEVPADFVYATMAIGTPLAPRCVLFFAPFINFPLGVYLVTRIRGIKAV